MAYYGSIVLSRSDSHLTVLPDMDAIGYQHRRLRELGEGWQVLETAGLDDPPDMAEAVGRLAGLWASPVLAAHVSGSHCAQLHGALPGEAAWSTHLPYPADADCGYRHRPVTEPGGSIQQAREAITGWAEGAGLPASRARLDRILRQDGPPTDVDRAYSPISPQDLVFELLRALGFRDMPAPRPYDFDPDEEPYNAVVAGWWGLADRARSAAAHRVVGDNAEPPVWQTEAIRLQCDIYSSLYGGAHSPEELAARAEWVTQAHRAAEEGTEPPPRTILLGGRPATNIQHVLRTSAAGAIGSALTVHRANLGGDAPNGVYWGDSAEGEGRWPDLP
ncbi:hypothetical protein AB0I28_17680 [Phytomonospora sp. NPDC050363]|uniref:hypothetical protein n=1 Tax=Phytomonospora sp. NPDC050363 TaxID=3155642 RepID=UPI0033D4B3BD